MDIRGFVYGKAFNNFIVGVILLNSGLIGVETYMETPFITTIQATCIWIFVVEILLKFAYRSSTKEYFRDGWNIFDIIIVGAAFIPPDIAPSVASLSTVLRVLRVFRVLRLIKGVAELRLIVSVLAKSMVSMTYISILMFIAFYIYAIIGVELFGKTQPDHYGSLHESFFSLFRSLTCEDWTDLRYAGVEISNYWIVTIFHVSWIVISTFVMINLVVGAIINNYQEVQEVEKNKHIEVDAVDQRINELLGELQTLMKQRTKAS